MDDDKYYCNMCHQIILRDDGYYHEPGAVTLCRHCLSNAPQKISDIYYVPPINNSIIFNGVFRLTEGGKMMQVSDIPKKFDKAREHFARQAYYRTPKQIKEWLDRYIIGQEDAKKLLSIVASNHQKINDFNSTVARSFEEKIEKSNLMIIGPSGSGKTYMVETLAKFLGVPFISTSASEYSSTGYVGRDINDLLVDLIQVADKDLGAAQEAIIFIDEVDKIVATKNDNSKDVNGAGIQHELLKLIEGTIKPVSIGRHTSGADFMLDTSGILFIFGGAFTDLREKKLKEKNKNGLGFGGNKEVQKYDRVDLSPKDLIEAGLIKEFIGRIHHVVSTEDLSDQALKDILTKPVNSIINQHERLLRFKNIPHPNLRSKKFLDEIVKEAKNIGTGARGLKVALEQKLTDYYYRERKE